MMLSAVSCSDTSLTNVTPVVLGGRSSNSVGSVLRPQPASATPPASSSAARTRRFQDGDLRRRNRLVQRCPHKTVSTSEVPILKDGLDAAHHQSVPSSLQ